MKLLIKILSFLVAVAGVVLGIALLMEEENDSKYIPIYDTDEDEAQPF